MAASTPALLYRIKIGTDGEWTDMTKAQIEAFMVEHHPEVDEYATAVREVESGEAQRSWGYITTMMNDLSTRIYHQVCRSEEDWILCDGGGGADSASSSTGYSVPEPYSVFSAASSSGGFSDDGFSGDGAPNWSQCQRAPVSGAERTAMVIRHVVDRTLTVEHLYDTSIPQEETYMHAPWESIDWVAVFASCDYEDLVWFRTQMQEYTATVKAHCRETRRPKAEREPDEPAPARGAIARVIAITGAMRPWKEIVCQLEYVTGKKRQR